MANLPTDIANQSLDAIGADIVLGDIEDGKREAQVVLRAYRQCLAQLLRAAHWDFARKTTPLVLLADASGNTANVGTIVPVPWIYEYAYPEDCMKVRFVPWNWQQAPPTPPGNIVPPAAGSPIMTNLSSPPLTGARLRPARFVVATDFNYPPPQGQITWETQGVSPQGRTVICTNVQFAQVVYTALLQYPSVWDALFRAAMVAYLASEIALPIWVRRDHKFGIQMRNEQIKLAKEKIMQARVTDGNEGHYSSDISVDWMRSRNTGAGSGIGYGGWPDGGAGVWGYGWDNCGFADGTAY